MVLGKNLKFFTRSGQEVVSSAILEQRGNQSSILLESNAILEIGVLQLNAGQDTVLFLALVTGVTSVGKIGEAEIFRITQVSLLSLRNHSQDEERVAELRRLLSSGMFYFSWNDNNETNDITLCAQRQANGAPTDSRFFWNKSFHSYFIRFGIETNQWLVKITCGSAEIRTVYAGHLQAKTAVISRLSCERVGTRFNVRGVNDDGSVANFVETEQLIYVDNQITSFLQVRGSIPLFWDQPGVQVVVKFPADYPYSPPHVRFVTKLWHPNVYENGDLCISILHPPVDDPQSGELPCERWNPTQNVRTVLLSVISLLNEPNCSSPANVDASVMYRKWKESKDKEYENIIK
ncbi:hypothetical protein QYM36_020111 [Artemia franciscana]|uniref:Phosphatidylinositol-3-phosphatase SAC1 n=1 Tax=Artemia franciscana TaxID=6661 RepID=A0AA88KTA6_ARTSF|nr:hypothetical protein QYM36_020111 [Artemia franciscana]